MATLRVGLVALVLVVAVGCGADATKSRRDAVDAYLTQVKTAQVELLGKEGQIDAALQSFSLTRTTPSELARLRQARATVDGALRRLQALHPPADARRLQALLVQRLTLQRSILDELVQATSYVPKVVVATAPLQQVAAGLRDDLRAAGAPSSPAGATVAPGGSGSALARYAAAFARYGAALKPVSARLHGLRAPAILRAGHDAEQHALDRSIALAAQIHSALLRGDITTANAAIRSLFAVSSTVDGISTQKAQAAAARAYDAQLRRVDTLAVRVNGERSRLVGAIG
ncbi:MAG: hypothetical protein ACRDM1_16570 [Gaiellaceae bacterium]